MSGTRDKISELGKNTRFPHNDPTKGGRRPSIRKQLQELALLDGEITFPKKQVKKIHEDGKVTLIIPKEQQLAMKLFALAMGSKDNTAINAIKTIMEQFDGKPLQPVADVTGEMSMDDKLARLRDLEQRAIANIPDEDNEDE